MKHLLIKFRGRKVWYGTKEDQWVELPSKILGIHNMVFNNLVETEEGVYSVKYIGGEPDVIFRRIIT